MSFSAFTAGEGGLLAAQRVQPDGVGGIRDGLLDGGAYGGAQVLVMVGVVTEAGDLDGLDQLTVLGGDGRHIVEAGIGDEIGLNHVIGNVLE